MNILVVGLGSIGMRHLNNIISLGYSKISVVTSKRSFLHDSCLVKSYCSLSEAVAKNSFDAVLVCTPTAYHVPAIIELLCANIGRIYVEKPISHNLDRIKEVLELSRRYQNEIFVGYDLHFDPGLMKVRELIERQVIGKAISVNAVVGQYLPDWRPHEDYRKGMSARVETGGGVMLDLIHEFDYLYWLFGEAQQVGCFSINSGSLEIETEDIAEVIIRFKKGILGSIHLDYLQQELVRNCLVTGSKGCILWNLAKTKVSWIEDRTSREFSYDYANRNDRFLAIMKAFLSDARDDRLTTLKDGIESLKMVVAAKQASLNNSIVSISKHMQM